MPVPSRNLFQIFRVLPKTSPPASHFAYSTRARDMPKNKSKAQKSQQHTQHETQDENPVSQASNNTILIQILAKPGAKQNNITSVTPEGVAVQIAAPPVEGEANTELVKYIASVLGVRKSDVSLEKGSRSRKKCLSIQASSQVTVDSVLDKLKKGMENG